jgi:hypothetical protein
VGALTANRKALAVTEAAIAGHVHQALLVHRLFATKIALDAEQDALRLIDRTAATRNPFDAKYSKVEDADWETCPLVLDPLTVREQLSRGW